MTASREEIERRRNSAINAIRRAHGTLTRGQGATLFVSHHLNELDEEFWLKHCGVACPDAKQVLDILVLKSHWSEEDDDGIETFDFTLPGDVTDYVISVEFDGHGDVSRLSMES